PVVGGAPPRALVRWAPPPPAGNRGAQPGAQRGGEGLGGGPCLPGNARRGRRGGHLVTAEGGVLFMVASNRWAPGCRGGPVRVCRCDTSAVSRTRASGSRLGSTTDSCTCAVWVPSSACTRLSSRDPAPGMVSVNGRSGARAAGWGRVGVMVLTPDGVGAAPQ